MRSQYGTNGMKTGGLGDVGKSSIKGLDVIRLGPKEVGIRACGSVRGPIREKNATEKRTVE